MMVIQSCQIRAEATKSAVGESRNSWLEIKIDTVEAKKHEWLRWWSTMGAKITVINSEVIMIEEAVLLNSMA